jgi:DNA-binding beta-propeller fold protein YncE
MRITFIICFLAFFLGSCKEQGCTDSDALNFDSNASNEDGSCVYSQSYSEGVFVLSEGNFNSGNASLSFYNKVDKAVATKIFSGINGIPIGDIAQSITTHNDVMYLVVNNSGKIWKLEADNLTVVAEITGLPSPRYMTIVNSVKAYVTNFQGNEISIVNLETDMVSGSIPVNGWTEEIKYHDGLIYFLGMKSNTLYKLNPNSDAVIDSVYLGVEPYSMEFDLQGNLWVLTTGGYDEQELPRLFRVDPITLEIEFETTFTSISAYPSNLALSPSGEHLYYTEESGLYRMALSATQLPTSPIYEGQFYGMNVDPFSGEVYVTDAIDYNQKGLVYRLSETGSELDVFQVGVIPKTLYFKGL